MQIHYSSIPYPMRSKPLIRIVSAACLILLLGVGCSKVDDQTASNPTVADKPYVVREAAPEAQQVGEGGRQLVVQGSRLHENQPVEFEASKPFQRVGLQWDARSANQELEARVLRSNNSWTAWQRVTPTWQEELLRNGAINADGSSLKIQTRTTDGQPMDSLSVEFFD